MSCSSYSFGERERNMSQCIVPKWNLRQGEGEERNRSPHVHSHQNLTNVVPMSNLHDEVRELRWENGQISVMHGINNLPKQTWEEEGGCNTLESIVNQATNFPSSSSSQVQVKVNMPSWTPAKRVRSYSYNCDQDNISHTQSACGSASATFGRDADATMMTWASLESPRSLKSARLTNDHDHDSLYQDYSENQEGERTTKEESCPSQSSARRSRAAAVHNLSERRRRDRINQKMKTLQKLVPNASKTDKASMLDEVIEYLKQLQAQIHMMSNARNMPMNMVMPIGMQQLQMSLMARMGMGMGGMGMGMGMLDVNNLNRSIMPHSFPSLMHAGGGGAAPSYVPPPFTMPPPLKPNVDSATVTNSIPNFNDAYNTFIAQQSMNMDFLNKMSALYRQQQPSKKTVGLSQPNHGQGE